MKEVVKKRYLNSLMTGTVTRLRICIDYRKLNKATRKDQFPLSFIDQMLESFNNFLANLEKVLERCEQVNLVLNWEKCYFMAREGIVLGHLMSKRGIEVDKAKIEWNDVVAAPTNDAKVVIKLFKKVIFLRFGVPRVVINDGGSHFIAK
ncbi:uncharacterized protein [Cicer arietinum]|uniref:uncharacterized protein n=1 Tax=Cicer arietinum TaxID=3827 RepID=UPI003CC64AB4